MASLIRANITTIQNANSLLEQAVIATLSVFIDHMFSIGIDDDNLVLTIPPNWKDAILMQNHRGKERGSAEYSLRRKSQNFYIKFSFSSTDKKVTISLTVG